MTRSERRSSGSGSSAFAAGLVLVAALAVCLGPAPAVAQEEEDIGGIIDTYKALLAVANQKLDDLELPEALAKYTEVIDGYKSGKLPSATPLTRQIVGQAYEGRARTHANMGNNAGAEADYEALIRFDPTWPVDRTRTSPKILALYDKVRARLLGRLAISSDPAGASVTINGEAMGRAPLEDREVPAGTYTVVVELAGYAPVTETIALKGGERAERVVKLVPNARSVLITTAPTGARVSVDGQPRGVTFGAAGPEAEAAAAALGLKPADLSAPLLLEHLAGGSHEVRVEKECHEPQTLAIQVAVDPNDLSPLRFDPVKLSRSAGSLVVESTPAGAEVLLDGEPAGRTPLRKDDVCSGRHEIRLRHPDAGQWAGTVDVTKGQRASVKERLRMTLAWLGMTEAGPGGKPPEGEAELGKALSMLTTWAVLAPGAGLPDDRRARGHAGNDGSLPADFIAGVASATGADLILIAAPAEGAFERRAEVRLISARYPSLPADRLLVRLDDETALKGLVDRLDRPTPLTRPWLGVRAIEVHRAVNPLAIRVQPGSPAAKAGVRPGEALVSLGGHGLARPADLDKAVAAMPEGAQASLMLQAPGAPPRQVNIALGSTPVMVPMDDPSELYARLAAEMSWRARAEAASGRASSPERGASLLNLAVALMQASRHEEALKVLNDLNLPAGAGISSGTVSYLRGICLKALKKDAEARKQLEFAASQPDATLWSNDGPPVAERARRLMAGL